MGNCILTRENTRTGSFVGIDTSNLLASGGPGGAASRSYTATQDCWVCISGYNLASLIIDDVALYPAVTTPLSYAQDHRIVPLRKGQTLKWSFSQANNFEGYKVFGLI